MANANIELPIRWPLSAFTIFTTRVIGTESLNFWFIWFFCVYKLPVNDMMMMCVCVQRSNALQIKLFASCDRMNVREAKTNEEAEERQKKCIMIETERETKRRRRKAETSSSGRILQWLVRNGEGYWNDSHNQSSIAVVDFDVDAIWVDTTAAICVESVANMTSTFSSFRSGLSRCSMCQLKNDNNVSTNRGKRRQHL